MTNRPAIFAHRGARRVAPENTLPAFERALAMGVDGIEFDVHVTSDDRLVVIHDFTVEKTTNGEGAVAAMCEAEVRGLDAGSHFSPHFAGVQVPLLEEVLELVGNRCRLNLEIKSMDPYANDASAGVAAIIRQRKLYDQVLVSSFNPEFQERLRHNVVLSGGGALMDGLNKRIEDAMAAIGGGRVAVVEEPLYAGANGALQLAVDMPGEYWQQLR